MVDGGEGYVGHDLLYSAIDILNGGMVYIISQSFKDQTPLRRDFQPLLPQNLTKFFN